MTAKNNGQEQYELAIPRPDALVESLRSMGYSLSTAIADIVDNSIAASAKTVWYRFPLVWAPFIRRGLVMGNVQSGSTANYAGLICKAADAGYKVIIVLAGMHNNLRSQTQVRLDEGFLGYKSVRPKPGGTSFEKTGVGMIDTRPCSSHSVAFIGYTATPFANIFIHRV